jgi:hypothetical protein
MTDISLFGYPQTGEYGEIPYHKNLFTLSRVNKAQSRLEDSRPITRRQYGACLGTGTIFEMDT